MFSRLRCHYCGNRSTFSKGTRKFQCASCEAYNYFDSKGTILDTPYNVASKSQSSQPLARLGLGDESPPQNVFCNTCRKNQQIRVEAIANYLPDESDPSYHEYESQLPDFYADLDRKYPPVCKKCAYGAQGKVHAADRYGKERQAAGMMKATREGRVQGRGTSRDDWNKWTMRRLLDSLRLVVYASLLLQLLWHAYGIRETLQSSAYSDEVDATDFFFEPTFRDCAKESYLMRFHASCFQLYGAMIPKALIASFLLLWYNTGLKKWYHSTDRIEVVDGQTVYFRIQALFLIVRAGAYYMLSYPDVSADFTKEQLLAAHISLICFLPFFQWLSERSISSEDWKLQGKIMPHPKDQDVFGVNAGPAPLEYDRKASSVPPQLRLFPRDEKPFPIENLAPKRPRGYSKLDLTSMPPPSPPDTDSLSDDTDAMDVDGRDGTTHSQLRSAYNWGTTQPLGWGGMRNELFGIQDNTRAEDERRRQEAEERAKLRYQPPVDPSPFRSTTRLPQAPMSMERRLRNPPRQVEPFKAAPLSKQQDFMKQMRGTIDNSKGFSGPKQDETKVQRKGRNPYAFDDDDDFSPVKDRARRSIDDGEISPAMSRTKGSLDLRHSTWHLPSDYNTSTGLEDIFGTNFSIGEQPSMSTTVAPHRQTILFSPALWLVVGALVALATVLGVAPWRQAVCLWLVQQFELHGR